MAKRKQPAVSQDGEESPSKKTKRERKERPAGEVWSRSKKKRMRRLKAKLKGNSGIPSNRQQESDLMPDESQPTRESSTSGANREHSSLQQSFKARLTGSRFRELNEQLYTTTSTASFKRFSTNPELYEQYHEGFRHQVEQWPVNPVDIISHWIIKNFGKKSPCVLADFGCGDAALAQKLIAVKHKSKCPFVVHSFDLVASSSLVTACDMANVPLEKASVDVAVFCLSLMGTNLADFVREAHRVLNDRGTLKIAEVRSRFESTANKNELKEFIDTLDKLGFKCLKIDKSNKMFVLLELKKNGKKPNKGLTFTAKPCIYKRR